MILGITGGIGSGKSTAADILKNEYGFLWISTDCVASELMNSDACCREQLSGAFGPAIYLEDGTLDKARFREVLYRSDENRALSDSIVHPLVWKKVNELCADPEEQYLVETALPSDTLRKFCDKVWVISAAKEVRIERLMKNRGYTREYAENIISKQMPEEEICAFADTVIDNSLGYDELKEKIRMAAEAL